MQSKSASVRKPPTASGSQKEGCRRSAVAQGIAVVLVFEEAAAGAHGEEAALARAPEAAHGRVVPDIAYRVLSHVPGV